MSETTTSPIVETTLGRLTGSVDAGIAIFRAIPYAASTAGAGRFRAPRPAEPWTGVRDATAAADRAPQRLNAGFISGGSTEPMSEDCLRINVWTPATDGAARPVLVWLHGGGFSAGSSFNYDGSGLARRGDVVVVSLNHRLNVFGHLYLADLAGAGYADSGNAGVLDIVEALRWVRDNVGGFGGDPGNVTIFGESGGAAKVSVLMAMPAARGLFHRAAVQSGSHLHAWTPEQATDNTRAVLDVLGIAPERAAEVADVPMQRLVEAYETATSARPGALSFSPVIDGHNLARAPWEPDAPGESAGVPLLVGSTRTETSLLIGGSDSSTFRLDGEGLRQKVATWLPGADVESVVAGFERLHPDASPSELFFLITTDVRVRVQGWAQADRKSAQGGAGVWHYELHWGPPTRHGTRFAPHTLDIPLVFDTIDRYPMLIRGDEALAEARVLADQMAPAWLAFARSGDPNHAGLPDWPEYTAAVPTTMVFDHTPRAVADWRGAERRLLADLPIWQVNR